MTFAEFDHAPALRVSEAVEMTNHPKPVTAAEAARLVHPGTGDRIERNLEERAMDPKPTPDPDDTEAELVDDTDEQRSPTDDRQDRGETGGAGTIEGRSPEQRSEDPA